MLFAGSLGIFGTLFLLFVRFAPVIPMNEIKMMLLQAKVLKPEAEERIRETP